MVDADTGLIADNKLPSHLFHKIRNSTDKFIIPGRLILLILPELFRHIKEAVLKDIVIWNKPNAMGKIFLKNL